MLRILLLLLLMAGCSQPAPEVELRLEGQTMGTSWSVRLPGVKGDGQPIRSGIEAELQTVINTMSTWEPNSALSRFNAAQNTEWHPLPSPLAEVIQTAQRISVQTDGSFDVTVGPLVQAWGFGHGETPLQAPDEATLSALRERIGHQKLELDARRWRKHHPQMEVDVSAIAKGYAVDRIANYLERDGYVHYLVEIGGELRVQGRNIESRPWRIAVEKPLPGQRSVQRVLALESGAVATSGDYRNYLELDGERYTHVFDPAQGQPVEHRLASVTVLHAQCMLADAYATALFVMGPERGMALAEQLDLAVLFVQYETDRFVERASPTMQELLEN